MNKQDIRLMLNEILTSTALRTINLKHKKDRMNMFYGARSTTNVSTTN
jgi:hypothetical protein